MSPYPTQWANYDPKTFMCCLCFSLFNVADCAVDDTGQKIDVCVPCWKHDNRSREVMADRKEGTVICIRCNEVVCPPPNNICSQCLSIGPNLRRDH